MKTFGRCLFAIVNLIQVASIYITFKLLLSRNFFTDNVWYPYAMMIRVVYISITILCMLCYYRASFTDAGPIMVKNIPEPRLCEMLSKECDKCKGWKPPRAHHCKNCKKCVFRMDHHCEWINNCVGYNNQKYFILFLLYTFIQTIITFFLVLISFVYWLSSLKTHIMVTLFNITATRVAIGGQLLMSILFTIFTGDFLYDQITCIIENQTTVESHKEVFGRPGKFLTNFIQVFGTNKSTWLLPLKPQLPLNYLELVYHYEYVIEGTLFLEDQFDNKENKHFELFQKYKVHQN